MYIDHRWYNLLHLDLVLSVRGHVLFSSVHRIYVRYTSHLLSRAP